MPNVLSALLHSVHVYAVRHTRTIITLMRCGGRKPYSTPWALGKRTIRHTAKLIFGNQSNNNIIYNGSWQQAIDLETA